MYKWKYDSITDAELNVLYIGIKDIIWHHINPTCCRTPREDMFQSIWAHLGFAKKQWNELSSNKVSTWMWLVVQNYIKNIKYYEVRERNHMVSFSEYVNDETEDVDHVMNSFCDCRNGRSMLSAAILEWEAQQSDLTRRIIELIIDPNADVLGAINARKKYYSTRVSKANMAALLGISRVELNDHLAKMKADLKGFLNDYPKLLVYER